jgi:ribonuclease HI
VRQLRTHPVYLLKDILSINKVIINVDGAARGNPGPAAIGAVIKDETGNVVARLSRPLGVTTNNQAEYQAIIIALEKAISLGAKQVTVKSDSELVVNQINGRYKIKNTGLRPLYVKVVALIGKLEGFSINCIPREQNAGADALANRALDNMKNVKSV